MKFVAVLSAAVWLSLYAQVDSVFYIEIAGDREPADEAKQVQSGLLPQPELEHGDSGSCRSLRAPGQKPLKGGTYLCSHVDTHKEPKTMKCIEPDETVKSDINYNANFFVVSKAQLATDYTLLIDDVKLKSLPDVMMVGFSVTGQRDNPMFTSHKSCYDKQEIVHAEAFRNFLPSDTKKQKQLTNFFCCTNPHACLFGNPVYVIDNYFPVIRDILQKCIAEDGKPPPSKKELKRSRTNKGDQPGPAASGKTTLGKSRSFVTNFLGKWNVGRTLQPLGSMRGFKQISKVISRQGSGNSYVSDSDSENGSTSPNKSGSTSPSKFNSKSRSPSLDRQLNVEGDDTIDLMEQYKMAERNLDDVMKIMLNRLIDPCVLMDEGGVANNKGRKEVLQKTCQTYCEFLGVATGRLTPRSTLKLVIKHIAGKSKNLVTCQKFNHGECVQAENNTNNFCKCFMTDRKGKKLDRGRRMVFCDNHLRNYLTPISMCK